MTAGEAGVPDNELRAALASMTEKADTYQRMYYAEHGGLAAEFAARVAANEAQRGWCPTCEGLTKRETTDMVCMTCGRDYMPEDGSDVSDPGLGWKRLMRLWREQCKQAEQRVEELTAELGRAVDQVGWAQAETESWGVTVRLQRERHQRDQFRTERDTALAEVARLKDVCEWWGGNYDSWVAATREAEAAVVTARRDALIEAADDWRACPPGAVQEWLRARAAGGVAVDVPPPAEPRGGVEMCQCGTGNHDWRDCPCLQQHPSAGSEPQGAQSTTAEVCAPEGQPWEGVQPRICGRHVPDPSTTWRAWCAECSEDCCREMLCDGCARGPSLPSAGSVVGQASTPGTHEHVFHMSSYGIEGPRCWCQEYYDHPVHLSAGAIPADTTEETTP